MEPNTINDINRLKKVFYLDCTNEEFADKVDWCYVLKYNKVSEDFIREFFDKIQYKYIFLHGHRSRWNDKELTIDGLKRYWIVNYQTVSEEFIREFDLSKYTLV